MKQPLKGIFSDRVPSNSCARNLGRWKWGLSGVDQEDGLFPLYEVEDALHLREIRIAWVSLIDITVWEQNSDFFNFFLRNWITPQVKDAQVFELPKS